MLDEHLYSFSVNGRILSSLLMMKGKEKEYAYGYLTTEGIVPADKIESVMVDDTDISVLTTDTQQVLLPKKTVVSGCGGTASYLDAAKLPVLSTTAVFPAKEVLHDIFSADVLRDGGFSAAVVSGTEIYRGDDTGQIQAADKAIGAALMKKANLSSAVLVISGKVSADLVRKCLNAGIPGIMAKYPATTLAASIAKEGHLTIRHAPELS
ncbi:MAG TPA: formate dehydrogenase accessory sulfurtransferase FdhD [Methanocorpusculum sp.]|nr:formate dehydrogenase accessory sulfurtransferase FdhD [Methanocorpusculum sp.]